MADGIHVTVKGIEQLKADLRRLSTAAQTRLARNAVMAMARVVARRARLLAPAARIRKSIKARRDPDRQLRKFRIVAFANARHRLSPIFEYSKGLPRFTKAGRYSGVLAPRPFLRPALDESYAEIQTKLVQNLSNGIEREVRKQQVAEDQGEA